ncbi:MAG: extracellular solute-binding protein [Stackebrandtia sp.]
MINTPPPTAQGDPSRYSDIAGSTKQDKAWKEFTSGLRAKWEGRTLKIVNWQFANLPAWQKTIPQFEQLTGAKVETEWLSYPELYLREVSLGNSNSSAVDIFLVDMPWVGKFATSGYVEPLNEYLEKTPKALVDYNDFFEVMREGAVWEGQITGIPSAPFFGFNVYNKKLLDKAGVSPPRDFDDLRQAAQAVAEQSDGTAGVVMNNQTGSVVGQAFYEYIYNMGGKPFASEYPGSPDYYADMTPQFTSKESIAVVNLFKDLLPYQPPGKLNMEWNSRAKSFAAGEAALMSPWNDELSPLTDPRKSKVVGDFGVQPALHDSDTPLNTPVGGYEMGINRHSTQKDLAWDFTLWFTSPQTSWWLAELGGYPTRYSVLNDPDLIAKVEYYETLRQVVDTSFAAFRPQIPESFEIIEALGNWIAKALYGELSVEDAMERANQEIGTMLREAGYVVQP